MISILIPIFNGIEFIDESVQSVINQTVREWELIIGINGHEKNSEAYKIANTYTEKDTRIRVIDLDSKGKAAALNEMITYCKYDWVSILDVDDKWFATKLLTQLHYMKKYDVIGTKCRYFGNSSKTPDIHIGDLMDFSFYNYNPIINSSCLVRKELCNWDSTFGLEDYDLWLRLNKAECKFFNVNSIQVLHRIHDNSAFNSQENVQNKDGLLQHHKKQM